MYLSAVTIKNFRSFGPEGQTIKFNKGLTVLVGENDSGKTAIIDAIKIVLGATDFSRSYINITDFYQEDTSNDISIICKFEKLSDKEQGAFLENLTTEDGTVVLYIHWQCNYNTHFIPNRPITKITTGRDGNGPSVGQVAKEMLRVTYLKPLRDAYSDMQAGRNSRLSQIIQGVPDLRNGEDTYTEGMDLNRLSLVGITNLSNKLLTEHAAIKKIQEEVNEILQKEMLLRGDTLTTKLEVAGSKNKDLQKIIALLEKLDLAIDNQKETTYGRVGLGTSNVLSMVCELLLNKGKSTNEESSFLLIEEPEAHIHAQRQLKLIQSMQKQVEDSKGTQQIIITTHSPLLASVVKLENIIIIKDGKSYPLASGNTKLEADDYKFLEKYIDATKANFFFARSVIIVEGPGEALLLPTLAKLLDCDFTEYGVSLVDVRGVGLSRYAKIFQRENKDEELNINVSCVTDRDVMPDCAPSICLDDKYSDKTKWPEDRNWKVECELPTEDDKRKRIEDIKSRADGQKVCTFIPEHWTLEYDIVFCALENEELLAIIINSMVVSKYVPKNRESKKREIINKIKDLGAEEKASTIYSYFSKGKVSKADFAQEFAFELESNYKSKEEREMLKKSLPQYLVKAIEYVTKGQGL